MTCKCSSDQSQVDLSIDLGKASEILNSYNSEKSNLITLLQEIQLAYGYLPEAVLKLIADVTGIKEAKILGVATFYSQFRLKPVGKHLIMLCQGTACHVNGSGKIEQAVKEELGIAEGDMTADGLFTYINVACLGCCSLAPVMMINDQTYAKLTPEKASKILKDLRIKEAI